MKIDVLIEYDEKLSEVAFSSKTTNFSETRPARIGLSHSIGEDLDSEQIEFVGENWELIKNIDDLFRQEPTGKNRVLRVINPFEVSTFEPRPAFAMVRYFAAYIHLKFYPKSWGQWRFYIKFLNPCEVTVKIPGYNFYDPQKKMEFEKLLHTRFRNINIIS